MMDYYDGRDVLECQQCGRVIRKLTDAEAQEAAERPLHYIRYCGPCAQQIMKEIDNGIYKP